MKRLRTVAAIWRRTEFAGLMRDAWWVSTWQGAVVVADILQLALVARGLGISQYGRLALVVALVTLVSQFFNLRVGTAATAFAAPRLHAGDVEGAAGIFQISYVMDVLTGILGFCVVTVGTVVASRVAGVGDAGLAVLFASTLLISSVDDSSSAVLRVFRRFRLLAGYRLALEALRLALIATAVFAFRSLYMVVLALVVYDLASAIADAVAAAVVYRRETGVSLLRPALRAMRDEQRALLAMVLHSNVVSYSRIAMNQLPTLLVGAFAGPAATGAFKAGTSVALLPGRLVDPAYAAILPRLSRLYAAGRLAEVRKLVRHACAIAIPAMVVVTVVVVLARHPILRELAGVGSGSTAATVVAIAIVGSAVDGALFWNDSVLFAAKRSKHVAGNAIVTSILQIVLLLSLIPPFGAVGAASAIVVSKVLANARLTWFALRALRPSPGASPNVAYPARRGHRWRRPISASVEVHE